MRILFEDAPQWLFLVDILLKFNKSFYNKGDLITNKRKIIKNYIKGEFIWDFIVIAPYFMGILLKINYSDAILILRTNKMIKIA